MARFNLARTARKGALALALLLAAGASAGNSADEYTLDSQDKLKISVSEISAASGEVRVRLEGEFKVDTAGDVAIPLLGNISAAGMTAASFAASISSQFQARMRLVNPPVTAVEIVQHRPYYITGVVEKPGEYPFRPGMRVIHALSVAGGLAKGAAAGQPHLERDLIRDNGELNVLKAQREKIEARRARLEATIAGKDRIDFPANLQSRAREPNVRETIAREQLVFDQQRRTRALELDKHNEQLSLLRDQIRTLQMQLETHNQQRISVDKELAQARKLQTRGLAPDERIYALERTAMIVDSDREEIRTEMLKVRERIADTEASIKQLHEPGSSELLAELNGLDGELESLTRKVDTVEDLIRQLHLDGAVEAGYEEQVEIRYSILREQNGQLVEEATAETSPVRPGDVIKITRHTTPPDQTSRRDLAVIGSQ